MKERRTIYQHQGYKLRSYTELMWARLMDALDIFYLYEPHLLQVEGCKYLPDFYLPSADMYLEVKGTWPTDAERAKAEQALAATGRPVVFLVARPESDAGGMMNCCLLMPAKVGWIDFSVHDLDQLYLEVAGTAKWLRAIMSVREDDMDRVRHIGDIVDEVLQKMSGRDSMESHLRMLHLRVNEERSQLEWNESIAEKGIKFWRNRYFPTGTGPAASIAAKMRASQ